MNRWVKYGDKW